MRFRVVHLGVFKMGWRESGQGQTPSLCDQLVLNTPGAFHRGAAPPRAGDGPKRAAMTEVVWTVPGTF